MKRPLDDRVNEWTEKGEMMEEGRKTQRWPCMMPCCCQAQKLGYDGTIVDLSREGAGIISSGRVPAVGSHTVVNIRPKLENVALRAKVVFATSETDAKQSFGHFGVEFVDNRRSKTNELLSFLP